MKKKKNKGRVQAKPKPDKFGGWMLAMGIAMLMAQLFETLFVMVARTVLKSPDAATMEDISPFDDKSFKQPVSALVKELIRDDQIDRELANRIVEFVESRNKLMHRLFFSLSSGSADTEAMIQTGLELSRRVYLDAGDLSGILLKLFMEYCERIPEAKQYFVDNKLTFDSIAEFTTFFKTMRERAFGVSN